MNDAIRVRTYSRVKEAMATGAFPAECGAAQIPAVIIALSDGRMDADDALRVANMMALGKANILFRLGGQAHSRGTTHGSLVKPEEERKTVTDYLAEIMSKEKDRNDKDKPRWRLPKTSFVCAAAVAADELCFDACETCGGAKQVPLDFANAPKEGRMPMTDCPTCRGTGKRTYTTAERAEAIAKAWAIMLHTPDEWPGLRDEIKSGSKMARYEEVIEWGKSKLLESERLITEGSIRQLGRS